MRILSRQQYNVPLRHCVSEQKLGFLINNRQIVIQNYRYSESNLIGKGFSSKVYKGYHINKNDQTYAIKVIDLMRFKQSSMEMLKKQIQIHKNLNHKNIVTFYDSFTQGTNCYIITQYCSGGDLMAHIKQKKRFQEKKVIEIVRQISAGYKYLIKMGIVHRDLKPANIFLSGNLWKIGDFGFAIEERLQVQDRVNVGTPLYMPLQALTKNIYSVKTDIFAIGIIAYQIYCGKTPWQCATQKQLVRKMARFKIQLPYGMKNQNLKQLILKGCEINQNIRLDKSEFQLLQFSEEISHNPQDNSYGLVNQFCHALSNRPQQQSERKNLLTVISTQRQRIQKQRQNSAFKLNRQYIKIRNTPTQYKFKTQQSQSTTSQQTVNQKSQTPLKHNQSSQKLSITLTTTTPQKLYEIYIKNNNILLGYLQICRFLYYMIKNLGCLLIGKIQKENVKMLFYKHLLKIIKQLQDRSINFFKLEQWQYYNNSEIYNKINLQLKQYSLRYQREYLDFLKNTDVNTIRTINKNFPELSQQNSCFTLAFFGNLKKYLKQLIRKQNHQVSKYLKTFDKKSQPDKKEIDKKYLEGLKQLYKYYLIIECTKNNYEHHNIIIEKNPIQIVTDFNTSKISLSNYWELRKEIKKL